MVIIEFHINHSCLRIAFTRTLLLIFHLQIHRIDTNNSKRSPIQISRVFFRRCDIVIVTLASYYLQALFCMNIVQISFSVHNSACRLIAISSQISNRMALAVLVRVCTNTSTLAFRYCRPDCTTSCLQMYTPFSSAQVCNHHESLEFTVELCLSQFICQPQRSPVR